MINDISLCQSYKKRKITELKKFCEHNNMADLMTKNKSFSGLKTLMDTNQIKPDITEWVDQSKRAKQKKEMVRN